MFGLHVINFNWHIANQLYKITLYLPTRSGSWQWFSRAVKYNCYPSKEALFYVYHCSSRKKAAYRGSLSVCNWSTTTIVCVNEKCHLLITANDKKLDLQEKGEIRKISNNLRIFLWGRYEHVDSYFPHMSQNHFFYWLLQTHFFITLEILFSKGQKM